MSLVGFVLSLVLIPRQEPTGKCQLVLANKPVATIVLPTQKSNSNTIQHNIRAALILQSSVKKMTGCELPIKTSPTPIDEASINIGFPEREAEAIEGSEDIIPPSPHPELKRSLKLDGFAVYTHENSLYISSGGKKGAIYGVIDLLEASFGCRCFSPTAYFFPTKENLIVKDLFKTENPAIEFRAVNGDFAADQTYLDWTRGNSTNEMFATGYYVHTFEKLLPAATNLTGHPEYFSFVNGRRTADQLCPSNPTLAPLIIARLKEEMAKQPDKHVWSVSQNDNESYCHCPDCTKAIEEEGAPSGPLLRFINKIAKEFPDETISTLAYQWSRKAPKLTKPESNVQIMLCTIEADRSRPIGEGSSTQDFVKDIRDWHAITDNIYLWDYTVNFNHQIAPFPNLYTLQPNIQFFVRSGVNQLFEQTNTSPGHEFSELKAYLLARLMWNPNADDQAIIHDFCQGYYGPAGMHIEQYITDISKAITESKTRLDIFESPTKHADDYLSAKKLDEYGNMLFLAAAATAAPDHEIYRQRVETVRLSLNYARMILAADDLYGPRGFYKLENGKPIMRIPIPGAFDGFLETAIKNNIRSINEQNVTPQQFRDQMVQLTSLDIAGNMAFTMPITAKPEPSKTYARGDLNHLTNGAHGGDDFRLQWLGWEGVDFEFTIDLGTQKTMSTVDLNSLSNGTSWILHPDKIECFVSEDGKGYLPWGSETLDVMHKNEAKIHHFSFPNPKGPYEHGKYRFVMFRVTAAKKLPTWHSWSGSPAWTFLDEVVIR